MSLVTRCPKCDSGFAVTATLLKQHDGLVRCGQCSHVFDGYVCLQDSLPTLTDRVSDVGDQAEPLSDEPKVFRSRALVFQSVDQPVDHQILEPTRSSSSKPEPSPEPVIDPSEPRFTKPIPPVASTPSSDRPEPVFTKPWRPVDAAPAPAVTAASPAPTVPKVSSQPIRGAQTVFAKPAVKVLGETRVRGEDPSASGRTLPDFMVPDDPEPQGPVLLWLSGLVLLLVVLFGQLIFIYRDDLASSVPALRPMLEKACQPFDCEVGYARRIERIFVVGSSLQQVPRQSPSGASQHDYTLRLTLQNRYNQAQPWPNLMVALSDSSGTVVIRKVVTPAEYLPPALSEGPFGPQQEASLAMPLRVEGSPVSGFEIDTFFP